MADPFVSEGPTARAGLSAPVMRRFIIYAGVLLVIFLLGFVPMWLKARAATSNVVETERQLILVKMQSNLASYQVIYITQH